MQFADSTLNQISLEYTYPELCQATQNFHQSLQLGTGSFGGVYKGTLRDGTEVAIKQLDIPEEAGFEEEVKVLSKFRHPNLVILMGFARHGTQRFLVYEVLAGGDVHKRLQRSIVENFAFTWYERLSVALDAACGLSHLHNASPKVFHRDIKSPNILLDKNGTAKMADFGLACLSHASSHRVTQCSGTVGYACPLYVQRGIVTEGSEVYSFGMVLMELMTAQPPASMGPAPGQVQYLVQHINNDIRMLLGLCDPKAQWPPSAAQSVGDFALRCTRCREEERPVFVDIVRTLRAILNAGDSGGQMPQPQMVTVQQGLRQPQILHVAQPQNVTPTPQQQQQQPQPQQILRQPSPQVMQQQRHPGPQVVYTGHGGLVQQQNGAVSLQQSAGGQQQIVYAQHGFQQHPVAVAQQNQHLVSQVHPSAVVQSATSSILLYALECIHSDGVNVNDLRWDQRVLIHRLQQDEQLSPTPPAFRVGRMFQNSFFDALVIDDGARSTISREHFQVWAEEVEPGRDGMGPTCHFFLNNFSQNGTLVNNNSLQRKGEQSVLRHGDIISLAKDQKSFLEFRFSLSGSILRQAEGPTGISGNSHMTGSEEPAAPPVMQDASATRSAMEDGPHRTKLANLASGALVGDSALFTLVVGGPGAFESLSEEERSVVYAPPPEPTEMSNGSNIPTSYGSFVVGRAHQLNFFQQVLTTDAFNTLSRSHFEIQTWGAETPGLFCFFVRNLSETNPVHLRRADSSLEDQPEVLAKNEQKPLVNGDQIWLNHGTHAFYLVFRDLTGSSAPDIGQQGDLGATEDPRKSRSVSLDWDPPPIQVTPLPEVQLF